MQNQVWLGKDPRYGSCFGNAIFTLHSGGGVDAGLKSGEEQLSSSKALGTPEMYFFLEIKLFKKRASQTLEYQRPDTLLR